MSMTEAERMELQLHRQLHLAQKNKEKDVTFGDLVKRAAAELNRRDKESSSGSGEPESSPTNGSVKMALPEEDLLPPIGSSTPKSSTT